MKYEMYVAGIGYIGQVNTKKEAKQIADMQYSGAKFILNKL